jgi:hypothetical protein
MLPPLNFYNFLIFSDFFSTQQGMGFKGRNPEFLNAENAKKVTNIQNLEHKNYKRPKQKSIISREETGDPSLLFVIIFTSSLIKYEMHYTLSDWCPSYLGTFVVSGQLSG